MKVAVLGAGWAGCAAAVEATLRGHQVTLFEAARTVGGRARRVDIASAGKTLALDNGQHILIGAYSETLALMRTLGVAPETHLKRLPLRLLFPNGDGLALPDFSGWPHALRAPASVQAGLGILGARGWRWRDKASLLNLALGWRVSNFQCSPDLSVAQLCKGLAPQAMQDLIEPLCVSALNTPAERASAQVFLRVMQDALFSAPGGSDLLLPRTDLSALLPEAALTWLLAHGQKLRIGERAESLKRNAGGWCVSTSVTQNGPENFDSVLLACPAQEAARLVDSIVDSMAEAGADPAPTRHAVAWAGLARNLQHEAIATVYAQALSPETTAPGTVAKPNEASLPQAMLALRSSPHEPAQFVFDRGQLGGPAGLLAFVVSASHENKDKISAQVLAQGQRQLGLPLTLLQTIVEKRSTFACTPGLQRPPQRIEPGLLACGDYIEGPYPATLEGAVRSGLQAARYL